MFEWFTDELRSIHTPKFHVTENSDARLEEVIRTSSIALSDDFKEFVVKFGNSRLFRQSLLGYKLGVLAGPRRISPADAVFQVGYDDGKPVYLYSDTEQVFGRNRNQPIAESFGAWFESAYRRIKDSYSSVEWQYVENGPRAFGPVEARTVCARKKFKWKEVGLSAERDRLLEVTNASDYCIPCLTLGVRSSDENLNGAVIVEVGNLLPGMTDIFALGCYKEFYDPSELSLFDLADIGPEDRDYIAELKRVQM